MCTSLYLTQAAARGMYLLYTVYIINLQLWISPAGLACTAKSFIVHKCRSIETNMFSTQFPPVANRVFATQLFLSSSIWLTPSFHMVYVTVPFPCPGATYTQGKHRVVCVDDCQQRPFIICQASVLRGGKYTQWIMVVLVCEQNPTWQAAEGRDKII